jgi:hypothetical protein
VNAPIQLPQPIALELPLPAFDLPLPRGARMTPDLGRMGQHDPAHGALVCASSSVRRDGTSTLVEPVGVVGRVAFAIAISLFFGAPMLGGLVDVILANVLPKSVLQGPLAMPIYAVPPIAAFVAVFVFLFQRWGKGQPFGETLFAGTDGAQSVRRYYADVTRSAVRYVDAFTVVHSRTRIIKGAWEHDEEIVTFLDARGETLLALSSLNAAHEAPTADAFLVAEVVRLSCTRRLERADAVRRSGGVVTFPLLDEGKPSPRSLALRGTELQVLDARIGVERVFDTRALLVRVNQGQLDIAPRDPSQAGLSVPFSCVGDGDVFVALLGGG